MVTPRDVCQHSHNIHRPRRLLVVVALWVACWTGATSIADQPKPEKRTIDSIKELLEEIAAEQKESDPLEDLDEDTAGKEKETDEDKESDDRKREDDEEASSNGLAIHEGRFSLAPLRAISTSTIDVGNGSTPKGVETKGPRPIIALPESGSDRLGNQPEMGWSWSVARWEAANTFSNPRYFEDRMLERHGHQRWGHLQPAVSGARFIGQLAMLPYLMSISPPCDCEYTLGYYRTGSCTPPMCQRPPWDRKAIVTESAAIATGILAFP